MGQVISIAKNEIAKKEISEEEIPEEKIAKKEEYYEEWLIDEDLEGTVSPQQYYFYRIDEATRAVLEERNKLYSNSEYSEAEEINSIIDDVIEERSDFFRVKSERQLLKTMIKTAIPFMVRNMNAKE